MKKVNLHILNNVYVKNDISINTVASYQLADNVSYYYAEAHRTAFNLIITACDKLKQPLKQKWALFLPDRCQLIQTIGTYAKLINLLGKSQIMRMCVHMLKTGLEYLNWSKWHNAVHLRYTCDCRMLYERRKLFCTTTKTSSNPILVREFEKKIEWLDANTHN